MGYPFIYFLYITLFSPHLTRVVAFRRHIKTETKADKVLFVQYSFYVGYAVLRRTETLADGVIRPFIF